MSTPCSSSRRARYLPASRCPAMRKTVSAPSFQTFGVSMSRLRCRASTASYARTQNGGMTSRSEEHTSELQSPCKLVCRLLLEKKNLESGPEAPRREVREETMLQPQSEEA